MNKILPALLVLFALVALAEAVWIWQFAPAPTTASLVIGATNAGVELADEDGRVYVHRQDQAGSVVAQGELGETLRLDPGSYAARVVFTRAGDGQSQWLRDLELEAGQKMRKSVEFDYGELKIEANVASGEGEAVAYVFAHAEHDRVVTSMPSDAAVLIAPGVYDLRVVLVQHSEERDVQWQRQVPVKPGLQTRIRVPFRRGTLLVDARNGEETLPPGAVELAVYRAGDDDREQIRSAMAGTPLGLASGRYDIAATFIGSHDKPVRWLRDIAVEEGATRTERVEFDSGTLVVNARLENGAALQRFQAYAYFYPAGAHREAVAYVTPPDPAVLKSGRYDVRVNFQRSHDRPDIWIRDVLLPAAETVSVAAAFPSGRLLLRAFDGAGNELIGDSVFVYVHARGARARPVAVARSGEIVTLTAGSYDLRIEDTTRPHEARWLEQVRIDSGRLNELAFDFGAASN